MSQSSPGTLWQTIPDNQLVCLLDRSHTLNGAVLVGLDGLTIEIQARAMNVDEDGLPRRKAVKISGMAKGAA
jgi:predicted regulator of Ras-like GTPase activity (Roadblock/LC7/MglB family)